jgi:predicted tellurium resistance membrane protein TerC
MTAMFYLLDMPDFGSVEVWMGLLTLTFLEIVLGVDNIIFISIASNKLKPEERPRARRLGLLMAMFFRVLLLMGISYIIKMQKPLFEVSLSWFESALTGQSLILIVGGIFLLYKATDEIHHKLEGDVDDTKISAKAGVTITSVVAQIAIMDIVFSFDSVLTAVGLADNLLIMIIAVVIAVIIMMIFADPVSDFVNEHPTIQMLGLSFLLLIGLMLIAEGAHLGNVVIAGEGVGTLPKGYLYFAISFSLLVEVLNMKLRKKTKSHVHFKGYLEVAREEGAMHDCCDD